MQRSPLTRLTDNNKRWIVFGIALNHALVPSIRPTFEQEIYNGYKNLLVKHGINVQTSHKFPSQYQESEMHYENINGNSKRPFNYKVTSHVDFGKLFLNGYMAQFNAFDETCDASAVLSMLGKIPIFPAALKSAADAVRSRRNYWAHCNFEEWTDEYFNGSFDAMDVLVKSFPTFPMEDLTNVLKDLTKWKEKGVQLCMGDTIDQELLKLVEDHVKQLSNNFKYMVFEHQAEKKMFYDNLFACSQRLDKLKHEHGKRLEELEMNVQDLQRQQISTAAKVDQFEMGNILLDKLLLVSEGLENSRRKAAVESNPGGYFDFNVITQRVQVVRDICVTAVSLGAIYAGYHLLRPLILYAVTTACGGERDDQQICDFKKGSLIVVLHCFTDERFLEFLQDYQSGRFLERLQKELSEINFKVKGMEVQILNDNEVCQTKEAIKKRMHSGLKTSLDIKTSKEVSSKVRNKLSVN